MNSLKFTDLSARKRNLPSEGEICVTPHLEKMEPTLPTLTFKKDTTKTQFLKAGGRLPSPAHTEKFALGR